LFATINGMKENNVRVGIGVFVIKDGKFLLLQRKAAHGEGTWSLPGGHMEFGESFEDTSKREVREETGLEITNVHFGAVMNNIFTDKNRHYVSVWTVSNWKSGKEYIAEPDKCSEMGWYTFDTLPSPLFLPWEQFLESEFLEKVKQELAAEVVKF